MTLRKPAAVNPLQVWLPMKPVPRVMRTGSMAVELLAAERI